MNRQLIFTRLLESLQQTLETAINAAADAHDLATHEQSKPETQYDTVGLEASYLAEGQSKRVLELKLAIKDWQSLQHRKFNDSSEINAGAIVSLLDQHDKQYYYLLGNYAGGTKIHLANSEITGDQSCVSIEHKKTIITVSLASPIGKSLLQRSIDDSFSFNNGNPLQFEITAIG